MTVASLAAAQLVVELPRGWLHHPILPGGDVCEIVRRLAEIVPTDAAWSVRPPQGNPG